MNKSEKLIKLVEEDFTDSTGFPTDDAVIEAAKLLGVKLTGDEICEISKELAKDAIEVYDKEAIEKAVKFYTSKKSESRVNEEETFNFKGTVSFNIDAEDKGEAEYEANRIVNTMIDIRGVNDLQVNVKLVESKIKEGYGGDIKELRDQIVTNAKEMYSYFEAGHFHTCITLAEQIRKNAEDLIIDLKNYSK